jgi:hypothetical protein
MEPEIRSLRIETFRAQLAVCNQVRAALSKELENVNLTRDQRIAIGRRCDAARKETRDLQFTLDLMERHEREARLASFRRVA